MQASHCAAIQTLVLAPIALFVYSRPEHTRRTLEALARCPEWLRSHVVVYADGAKKPALAAAVAETRRVVRELAPHALVVEQPTNRGLARSIIAGTTELCEQFGKVIVVEDDLDVAPTFLTFLNAGLDRYADDDRVMQVSAYQFPVALPSEALFLGFPTSWGWATWKRAWQHFDPEARGYERLVADPQLRRRFDLDGSYPYFEMLERQRRGEVDSWAIRWHLSVFLRGGLVLYPGQTLVTNTGFDGSGTHGGVGQGFADDHGAAREHWELPAVALDESSQRRVFSFLAGRPAGRIQHVQHLAAKYVRTLLAHRRVPASVRAAGASLMARFGVAAEEPSAQDLELYWDPEMAKILDTWGEGTAWNEIQLLLATAEGKVLDIACGTGKVMSLLAPYPALEVHGFDISDFLIGKALARGIPQERLHVADATKTPYADDQFDFGYSIGSLEHFTEPGILAFVAEAHRITRRASFHMIPVARSGRDEGWMKTHQSFHNNSVGWWVERYRTAYPVVHVLESAWHDKISVGKWFVCVK